MIKFLLPAGDGWVVNIQISSRNSQLGRLWTQKQNATNDGMSAKIALPETSGSPDEGLPGGRGVRRERGRKGQ